MMLEIKHKGAKYQVFYDDSMHNVITRYKWHITKGYARTSLPKDTGRKRLSISMHRLILAHTAEHTHHINGNRLDNRLANLMPSTVKGHLGGIHRKTKQKRVVFSEKEMATRFKPGNYSPTTKLTPREVTEMREMHKNGISTLKIAELFNIGKSAAWDAVSGKSFKNI